MKPDDIIPVFTKNLAWYKRRLSASDSALIINVLSGYGINALMTKLDAVSDINHIG